MAAKGRDVVQDGSPVRALFDDFLSRLPDPATIMHLGCGDGAVLADVAARKPHARLLGYGRDLDDVKRARARQLERVTFALFDLALDRPPPAAGRVDGFICSSVSRQVGDAPPLWAHLKRLMKPGALLLVEEPGMCREALAAMLVEAGFYLERLDEVETVALASTRGGTGGAIRGWD